MLGDHHDWNEADTRQTVPARSGGVCERCLQCRATEMHHRKSRGVGGKWSPANVLHACHDCHMWITNHPEEAYLNGWSVRSHDDPQQVPVQRLSGEILYFSDDVSPPMKKRKGK
jgi:hypothetical protein